MDEYVYKHPQYVGPKKTKKVKQKPRECLYRDCGKMFTPHRAGVHICPACHDKMIRANEYD